MGEPVAVSAGLGGTAFPAWSTDGTLLAFAQTGLPSSVYVVDDRGDGIPRVVSEASSQVTGLGWGRPGERSLLLTDAAESGGGTIRTLDIDAGSSSVVAEFTGDARPVSASWSPDGRKLAYVLVRGGLSAEIWIDGLVGPLLERPIAPDEIPHLSWSPDAQFLSFWREQDTDFPEQGPGSWLIAADGSGSHPLTDLFGDQPAWQPLESGEQP
jgi:Tol biopolymer transport system component